ncbi:acyl-CoA N-acyltransferase [Pterulicium gracile]|uniref:Acyl-CoA N-acyltransferase n=1 Tax=Pterulicium gracile TaxID=1884261 RepID=A0A5C3QAN4_9AGAR|nr:acyl-CoA N-acyltransferase [Pterula gracilis]
MSTAITIRQIHNFTQDDLDTVVRLYSSAFAETPLHNISTNGHPELLSKAEAHGALIGGEVYVAEIDGKVVGAASWFPPGKGLFDSDEQRARAAGPFMASLEPEVQKWWMEYFLPTYGAEAERIFTPGYKLASYHLQTIGVSPDYQGKGIAKKLIEHVRSKAHPAGVPLCLEAITKLNSDIYTKVGFKLLGEVTLKGPDVVGKNFEFYLMSWEPKAN